MPRCVFDSFFPLFSLPATSSYLFYRTRAGTPDTGASTNYGPWKDCHMPHAPTDGVGYSASGSLMTKDRIAECTLAWTEISFFLSLFPSRAFALIFMGGLFPNRIYLNESSGKDRLITLAAENNKNKKKSPTRCPLGCRLAVRWGKRASIYIYIYFGVPALLRPEFGPA